MVYKIPDSACIIALNLNECSMRIPSIVLSQFFNIVSELHSLDFEFGAMLWYKPFILLGYT